MIPANILVVEDDICVSTVLQARLESFGHQVCGIAANGRTAIHFAKTYSPDLILMDIMLEGGMNGIEAAEQILEHQDTPIIFLTCLSDKEVLDRAISIKPYAYIIKPYDNIELQSTIEITLMKYKVAIEREELINDLENALKEIKRLSGLLPICAACKKIRNEENRWQPIEDYIRSRSEADFSHSICPDCARRLYPDLYGKDVKNEKIT